jgi:1-deoxy-D-xylulose-5-phosphate synthase
VSILDSIHCHDDLIHLNEKQRQILCGEIREFLINSVSQTGGHLASNLGAVELSVALETVFDTRTDRLVFDVGHQSYVHKMLTGRRADFARLRQFGGIAGFPKPGESETDAFVAGHASSSVSIALGMARARTLLQQDYHIVALIGDGAATGGMAYEGLNDAGDSGEPMVIILNDNEMSIDRNVGGLSVHLSRLRSGSGYQGIKNWYKSVIIKLPGGRTLYRLSKNLKDWLKRVLISTTIFENMGLAYLGPVDGNDTEELIEVLQIARDMKRPVVVHVLTQKGSGYAPAEQNPSKFHGIGKFDAVTGNTIKKNSVTFSDTFGKTITALANDNPRICAITAAMPGGTGLLQFKERFPDRLFDVGIAEEHAVSMSGGLAKQGMIPVTAIYSTFLQRAYDQIFQDVAMLGLHVILAVDRAGLVGEDGETHHGIYDVGFLRQVPGMRILCPASCAELSDMLSWAVESCEGPVAIRYPRGGDVGYSNSAWNGDPSIVVHRSGKDVVLLTYGTIIKHVLDAAEILSSKGIEATVLRLQEVSCVQKELLTPFLPYHAPVVCVEEIAANSGICAELAMMLQDTCVSGMDLGNTFVTHGSMTELYSHYGLDASSIAEHVMGVYHND